jgi:hypothetical protein
MRGSRAFGSGGGGLGFRLAEFDCILAGFDCIGGGLGIWLAGVDCYTEWVTTTTLSPGRIQSTPILVHSLPAPRSPPPPRPASAPPRIPLGRLIDATGSSPALAAAPPPPLSTTHHDAMPEARLPPAPLPTWGSLAGREGLLALAASPLRAGPALSGGDCTCKRQARWCS